MLDRFQMVMSNPATSPMNESEKLLKEMCLSTAGEEKRMKDVPYREAVGYLPRPKYSSAHLLWRDHAQPVQHQPWRTALECSEHLYVKGTSKFRFVYHRSKESTIDADWESDHDERKSTA